MPGSKRKPKTKSAPRKPSRERKGSEQSKAGSIEPTAHVSAEPSASRAHHPDVDDAPVAALEGVEPPYGVPTVVGLGASAGGLEALQTFFAHMPADTGLSFVVVTHQPANRTSLLPLLIAKRTQMTVLEASDGLRVQANHVYFAPPGRNLGILGGRLHTVELEDAAQRRLPINHFFRSLAKDQRAGAVGIVLSGSGSDGALGLKEIKASLGLAIVQREDEAAFPGMPHSAIRGDSPDFILPVAEIAEKVVSYARAARKSRAHRLAGEDGERTVDALAQIFLLLRQRTGHDFSGYKATTVRRRIERRMDLQRMQSVSEYAKLLRSSTSELELLFDELLIGVTSFFRDPDAFDSLGLVCLDYLANKPEGSAVRVWVAGCSTGEEAYSIAILLYECLERLKKNLPVQVFATDLDGKAIERARVGFYPHGIEGDLSAARLKRFFVRSEEGYQVKKEIRELLVFATQNLVEDPPFTKLDLMSCRNLLIYLDNNLQRRLFPIFHYVLKPAGMLLLGSSETLGSFANLFDPLDKKWRLFRRKGVVGGRYTADIPASVALHVEAASQLTTGLSSPRRADIATAQLADRLLLRELVPPTVLMRERGEILHIHGRTGMFLEPAPGLQSAANIYSMAREGLQLELAAAVREASREGAEVRRCGVRLNSGGTPLLVDLRVKKLSEPEALRGFYRVSFERPRAEEPERPDLRPAEAMSPSRVSELERELLYTKESHQSTIEELETANEELKSTNEELQSTNEELQSANEELETSKEELQSLNEELQTVNVELQSKVEELSRANDDMTNLLNATDIATIFLDNQLNIKRHTEQAKRVIRLIPSDVGRSIGDLVSRLSYGRLVEDAQEVLRTLVFKEIELQGEGNGHWYLMRIMPYRTTENVIDGLVVTFVDITRVKELQQNEQRLMKALQHSAVSVFGLDLTLRIAWTCSAVFGRDPKQLLGQRCEEALGTEREAIAKLARDVIELGTSRSQQVEAGLAGQLKRYDVHAEPYYEDDGQLVGVACVAVLMRSGAELS